MCECEHTIFSFSNDFLTCCEQYIRKYILYERVCCNTGRSIEINTVTSDWGCGVARNPQGELGSERTNGQMISKGGAVMHGQSVSSFLLLLVGWRCRHLRERKRHPKFGFLHDPPPHPPPTTTHHTTLEADHTKKKYHLTGNLLCAHSTVQYPTRVVFITVHNVLQLLQCNTTVLLYRTAVLGTW